MSKKKTHKYETNGDDKNIFQDLRMEFKKQVETLKRTQLEMKSKVKSPITQIENSKESLPNGVNQPEDTVSGHK